MRSVVYRRLGRKVECMPREQAVQVSCALDLWGSESTSTHVDASGMFSAIQARWVSLIQNRRVTPRKDRNVGTREYCCRDEVRMVPLDMSRMVRILSYSRQPRCKALGMYQQTI